MTDRGSVTAETALALPSVVLALALVACVGQVVRGQVDCQDAARSAARLAARGESDDQVRAAAQLAGPDGAQVEVGRPPGLVVVRVGARVRLVLPGRPVVVVDASAVAAVEAAQPVGVGG